MTKRTAADVEVQARKFAIGTAYPKGARAMMREVLALLDSARERADRLRDRVNGSLSAAQWMRAMEGGHDGSTPVPISSREEIERRDEMEPLRNPHDGADLARCDRRDLLELLSKAEQRAEAAEDRGVRWGLDYCHDLAVAAVHGRPNTTEDREAVAARVGARARAALGR